MSETIGEALGSESSEIMKCVEVDKKGEISNSYFSDSEYLIYGDTDSVAGDTMVETNLFGTLPISQLFRFYEFKEEQDGKEYSYHSMLSSPCLDENGVIRHKSVRAVYRHKVSKAQWALTANGKTVRMTNDHSCMVFRNGSLMEVKPVDIMLNDKVLDITGQQVEIESVVQLEDFNDEYVYDIIMEDSKTPYFFANGLMVHNSNYFMMPVDNKEDAIEIADLMAETVNAVFPTFMSEMFYCTDERSKLISAAREVVAIRGLFLNAKKKYTLRVVDKEGTETDELKFMGSELKKADTPKPIQRFLKQLMDIVLDDQYADVEEMYPVLEKFVNTNRKGLIHKTDDVLALGVAKQINNLEEYTKEWKQQELNGTGKAKLPGHVRAAVNFNHLADEFSDNTSKRLRSGDKGVIFYLRPNEYKIKTIAFPADTMRLPEWFTDEFRVDFPLTEEKMIDLKLEGIFEALGKPVPTPKLAIINKEFVRS